MVYTKLKYIYIKVGNKCVCSNPSPDINASVTLCASISVIVLASPTNSTHFHLSENAGFHRCVSECTLIEAPICLSAAYKQSL